MTTPSDMAATIATATAAAIAAVVAELSPELKPATKPPVAKLAKDMTPEEYAAARKAIR